MFNFRFCVCRLILTCCDIVIHTFLRKLTQCFQNIIVINLLQNGNKDKVNIVMHAKKTKHISYL